MNALCNSALSPYRPRSENRLTTFKNLQAIFSRSFILGLILLFLFAPTKVNGQSNYVWDGGTIITVGNWDTTTASWLINGAGTDQPWTNATPPNNASITTTSSFGLGLTVATVNVGSFSISSGTPITMIQENVGDIITISGPIALSGAGTSLLIGNNLIVAVNGAGAISAATGTITFQADAALRAEVTGAISGGTINLTQFNTLGVDATNALTTGATVNLSGANSRLQLNGHSTTIGTISGSGTLENTGATNATLTTNLTTTSTFNGKAQNGSAGTFALATTGAGKLILGGSNTYTGGTTIGSGGTVVARNNAALGTSNVAVTGTLQVQTTNLAIASTSGAGLSGTGTIENGGAADTTLTDNQSASTTFSGTMQDGAGGGTLALVMAGTGSLKLSGANTYTGGTTINSGGTVVGASSSALGNGNVAVNGTLDVQTANLSIVSLAGSALTGNGLIQNGSATNSTMTVSQTAASSFTGTIQNGGAGTLALTMAGSGSLTLSGANTYTGGTTISSGTVIAQNNSALGAGGATVNSTLKVQTSNLTIASTAGTLSGTGTIENDGAANAILTSAQSGTSTFAGTLTDGGGGGTLALAMSGSGSLTLTNANTYTGGTTISSGTVIAQNNSALNSGSVKVDGTLGVQTTNLTIASQSGASLTGSGTIRNGSASDAILTVAQTSTSTFAGGFVDGGAGKLTLNKTNSGTLILTGNSTHTGGTNVRAGTLAINSGGQVSGNAEVFSGATLTSSSGSGSVLGSVTIDNGANLTAQVGNLLTVGNLSFNNTSNFNAGLAAPGTTSIVNAGTGSAPGNVALNGFLNISDVGGFGAVGSYRLINYNGALSGSGFVVTSVPNGVNPGNLTLDLSTPGQVNLVVTPSAGPNGLALQYWDGSNHTANGAVDGGAGTWNNTSTNWTNAAGNLNGVWASSGAVFAGQPGTVTLGDNISFGGLFFRVDGYTINPSSFVLMPVGNALIQVVGSATATISAPMVGSGTATTYGSGTLILNASSPSSIGGLTIQEGKVLVNTVLQSPTVSVQSAGTLGGNGTIIGNVTNSGTVAPGNSVGLLTINGNYTQTSGGTFQLEIAGLNSFDQLLINGSATLDGTLNVETLGGFDLVAGQRYTFLAATGGINGSMSSVTGLPEGLRGLLVETPTGGPTTLTLVLGLSSFTLVPNLDQNQLNIARALEKCFLDATSGDRYVVDLALIQLPVEDYGAAFNQIGPAFYESFANTLIEQSNALGQFLEQRFDAIRLGSRGFTTVGFVAPIIVEDTGKNYVGKDYKEGKDILAVNPDNRWGLWVQGNGIFARNRSVNNVPSYRFASGGVVTGTDYQWFEGLATGVYSGYQGTYSKYQNGGRAIINGVNFGSYASYDAPGNGFYADGLVGGNFSSFSVRRPIKFGTIDRLATSRPGSGGLTSLLATGYDIEIANFTIGPVLTGQYTYVGIGTFTENGADSLDLKVRQQNANSIRTSVGGRVAYTWNVTDQICIIPEGRMSWQHEYLQYPRTLTTALDGGACPWFSYSTASPNRDAVFAGAGLIVQLGRHLNLNANYNADFGRKDFVSHMVSGGVNLEF